MSTPETQDKSPTVLVIQIKAGCRPADSCCTESGCAANNAADSEALNEARYSWLVEGMDCAACARKVETAVRQVPCVNRYRFCLPPKTAGQRRCRYPRRRKCGTCRGLYAAR